MAERGIQLYRRPLPKRRERERGVWRWQLTEGWELPQKWQTTAHGEVRPAVYEAHRRAQREKAVNYWEREERNPVYRPMKPPMDDKWKMFWFFFGCAGILVLIVACEIINAATGRNLMWGRVSVVGFRFLLKLL